MWFGELKDSLFLQENHFEKTNSIDLQTWNFGGIFLRRSSTTTDIEHFKIKEKQPPQIQSPL